MASRKKTLAVKTARKLRVLMIRTQADLICLAEDAYQAGDENLYHSLKKLFESFGTGSEVILAQYGVGTPKKPKTLLKAVE